MFKRIGFFFLTNILIMITISILVRVLGFNNYLTKAGLDYTSLAGFCLIWGMAGSIISLFLSKTMAKMSMGVKEVSPNGPYRGLYQTVQRLSKAAGIPMPEVGIYESPEVNAFATGPSRSNALVAVSTGLLNQMNENEVDAVLGHEIAHVANGDMVTMTLIQGVVNAFGMFIARIIGYAASIALSKSDEEESSPNFLIQFIVTFVLEIIFSILGSMVVAYFSRLREFRADEGGAKFAGRQNMIAALERLKKYSSGPVDDRGAALASLKISSSGGFLSLFSTHPPLEDRIRALKNMGTR
jgi:heat shock protein HtpX